MANRTQSKRITLSGFILAASVVFIYTFYRPKIVGKNLDIDIGWKTKIYQENRQEKRIVSKNNEPTQRSKESLLLRRIPQVICIGVKKCGTGALKSFLGKHPKVKLPTEAEPHFFDNNATFEKGVEYYRSLMPLSRKDEITMEKTPKYFVTEWVPERIHKFYASQSIRPKFILTLCNPIDRFYSEFVHVYTGKTYNITRKIKKNPTVAELVHELTENVSSTLNEIVRSNNLSSNHKHVAFTQFIRNNYEASLLTNGFYMFHLSRWLRYFSKDQLLIVNGEEIIKRPWNVIEKIQDFLGVDKIITKKDFFYNNEKGFYCVHSCLGDNKGRTRSLSLEKRSPFPLLTLDDRITLRKFYEPLNDALYKFLHRTFYW
uniref:heparan sulfate glucosamine 3-O-sulfotransferase 6-like n=1 Tax=Styela clava TaxID=7725 RepID=UPI0019397201|nr:heparan sulfate glucosamine 3-O-sulfotransferase 6-like [Styela clava]